MKKEVDKAVIEASTKKAQTLPESTQFALVTALRNISNGAFWGFTTVREVKKFAEELKKDSNIALRKLKGDDVILEVSPSYICSAMAYIDPSVVTQEDVAKMNEGIQKACAVFEKFLSRKTKEGYKGYIGIYCVNDVSSINFKGTTFPAFRLPLNQIVAYLARYNWKINLADGSSVFANSIGNRIGDVWQSIVMSPTYTGVFLNVSSR